MLELNSLTQELIHISTLKKSHKNIHVMTMNILKQLKFKQHQINTCGNEQHLYATLGEGHPHVLFVTTLPNTPTYKNYKISFPYDLNDIYAKHTSLACFIGACEKFITNNTFNGKISIFIQIKNNYNCSANLKNIFNKISLTPQNIDFCIIGEPNRTKKTGQEINIGGLGDILFTITSFGSSQFRTDKHTNAVQNLLSLLYKLKNNFLDNGNENFSSSSLSILSLNSNQEHPLQIPEIAQARILIHYNNNHTPQEIIDWMKNNINFSNGEFELSSEQISTPFISDISSGTKALQQSIQPNISGYPYYGTNCTSEISNFIKDYCPFAEFGLFSGKNNPTENISSLQNIYFQFLNRYFGSYKKA